MQRIIRNSLFKTNKGKSAYSLRNGALACILVAGALLGGCTKDDTGTGNGKITGDNEIILNLNIPYTALPRTRSVSPENEILSIDVLVFSVKESAPTDTTFLYRTYGSPLSGSFDKTRIKVKHTDENEKHHFVVMANVKSELDALTLTPGTSKAALMDAIRFDVYGETENAWSPTKSFPMWGDTYAKDENNEIVYAHTIGTTNTIKAFDVSLLRSVAKINIQLHEDIKNKFQLEGVAVRHVAKQGTVAAAAGNYTRYTKNDKEHVLAELPTIPGNFTPGDANYGRAYYPVTNHNYEYIDKWGTAVSNRIYVPENKNITSIENPIDHEKHRLCLIIKGKYDATGTGNFPESDEATYYRVDFYHGEGDMLDVLRNHQYTFRIKSIEGDGHTSEGTALKDDPINMQTEVLNWDEWTMDEIFYDGLHFYSVAPRDTTYNSFGTSQMPNKTGYIYIKTDSKYDCIYVEQTGGAINFFEGETPQEDVTKREQIMVNGQRAWLMMIPYEVGEFAGAVPEQPDSRYAELLIHFKEDASSTQGKVKIPVKIKQTNDVPPFKVTPSTYSYESGKGVTYNNKAWIFFNVEGYFDAATVRASIHGPRQENYLFRQSTRPVRPGYSQYHLEGNNDPRYAEYKQSALVELPHYGTNGFMSKDVRNAHNVPIYFDEMNYTYDFWVDIDGVETWVDGTSGNKGEQEPVYYIQLMEWTAPIVPSTGGDFLFKVNGIWHDDILWVVREGTGESGKKGKIVGRLEMKNPNPGKYYKNEFKMVIEASTPGVPLNLYYSVTGREEDLESCLEVAEKYENLTYWYYMEGVSY